MCLAVPMKVIQVDGFQAKVELGGVTRIADLSLIDQPREGDYIIMHAGFAIQKLDEENAQITLKLLEEMRVFDEENT